ncbi:MAG: hypothetical protein P8P30_03195 [Rickettsiales bacterium]|nr:hypothetical protein [Rickettsiales bacterium]
MRRNSKKLITLALVSSVAAMALMPAASEAQRNRRVNLPSVEIHLEVLNSLQRSQVNRQMARQQAPQAVRAIPMPAYTSDNFASEVVRTIPAARSAARSERVVQPLPRARARVASANTQVVMQPLPRRERVKVEPSEEQIIMQPLPQSASKFAIADSLESEAAPVEVLAENEVESASFIDQVAGLFSGDDSKKSEVPQLIEQPNIVPLAVPRVVGSAPVIVVEAPVLVDDAGTSGSFFSTLEDELNGSIEFEQPSPVNPSSDMIAQITSPELERAETVPVVKSIAQPAVTQRYEERLEKSSPAIVDTVVETVPALQPIKSQPFPVESPAAKVVELAEPERVRGLPVPNGFVIVEKVNNPVPAPVKSVPVTPEPIIVSKPAQLLQEPLVAPARPVIQKKTIIASKPLSVVLPEPTVSKVTEAEADFPRLSDVERSPAVALEELPTTAQDWLGQESEPTSPIAQMIAEVPTIEASVIADSFIEDPKEEILEIVALPEPVVEVAVVEEPVLKIETPKTEVPVAALLESIVAEPVIQAPVVEEPVLIVEVPVVEVPEIVELPESIVAEPVISVAELLKEPAKPMTPADESFLSNALDSEKDAPAKVASEDEKSFMELALEEVEPVEPSAPAVPIAALEEELALLEKQEPAVAPSAVQSPAAPVQEESMFPGITKTFKGLLGDKAEEKAPTPSVVPAKLAEINEEVVTKEETAQNVLPPELPVAGKEKEPALPSMDLLSEDVGARFLEDDLGLPELEVNEVELVEAPVVEIPVVELAPVVLPEPVKAAEPVKVAEPVLEVPKIEEFDVASLPPESKVSPASVAKHAMADLRIGYGVDDTDIPDAEKAKLVDIAKKAKAEKKRVIISSFASGEEDESKAANMISLSRGLSLRAFFIDNGIAMDRIIVQAKGLENSGGPADRADISLD